MIYPLTNYMQYMKCILLFKCINTYIYVYKFTNFQKYGLSHVWFYYPMDCSPPGFSVHEIFQASVLEWVAISLSMGSSQPTDWTQVSCIASKLFTVWATREAPLNSNRRCNGLAVNKNWVSYKQILLLDCVTDRHWSTEVLDNLPKCVS